MFSPVTNQTAEFFRGVRSMTIMEIEHVCRTTLRKYETDTLVCKLSTNRHECDMLVHGSLLKGLQRLIAIDPTTKSPCGHLSVANLLAKIRGIPILVCPSTCTTKVTRSGLIVPDLLLLEHRVCDIITTLSSDLENVVVRHMSHPVRQSDIAHMETQRAKYGECEM